MHGTSIALHFVLFWQKSIFCCLSSCGLLFEFLDDGAVDFVAEVLHGVFGARQHHWRLVVRQLALRLCVAEITTQTPLSTRGRQNVGYRRFIATLFIPWTADWLKVNGYLQCPPATSIVLHASSPFA